ncbi:putative S1 family peptidase [Phycisphaera mikurensis NBRC 102666]|uniref:Putative S1 family peptidase n=1 Tax=Phycisphaera mikurensis (strain NBRC 102666 / KCTC 22515 / FYK2301M01) TaxID=1142394 RepID=I0IGC5_PHYMF|nr:putative S1 family peptidase [Phycisphaera mikurensis NBRC 102666]
MSVLAVMLAGPGLIRSVAHARTAAEIVSVRNGLEANPSLTTLSDSFKDVARAVEPSVVHVEIQSRNPGAMLRRGRGSSPLESLPPGLRGLLPEGPRQPMPTPERDRFSDYNNYEPVGNGSGWVYRFPGLEGSDEPAANYIITNAHVVREVGEDERIRITLYDESVVTAEIVGRPDFQTDVAVLRVVGDGGADRLHPAEASTQTTEQGEIVFAFGSPFGAAFSFSMSQGIVSAVGRRVGIIDGGGYENFIQTDAAINPGNSGGPLANVRGEVIGMNTAIATNNRGPGGGAASSGVGFAIPVAMATRVADRIIVDGVVRRGFLGVRIENLSEDMAATFGYDGRGVLVAEALEGGAARAAGVRDGDIITGVDGEEVADSEQLRFAIANRRPGKEVELELFRGGESQTVRVELGSRGGDALASGGGPSSGSERGDDDFSGVSDLSLRYGITGLATLSPADAARIGLAGSGGVMITGVRPGSVAASPRIDLQPGRTVITAVMNEDVATVEDFNRAIASFDADKPIRLTVLRPDPMNPGSFAPSFVLLKLP